MQALNTASSARSYWISPVRLARPRLWRSSGLKAALCFASKTTKYLVQVSNFARCAVPACKRCTHEWLIASRRRFASHKPCQSHKPLMNVRTQLMMLH